MKKQPHLAKERIFKTLHPTFIPKPKPPSRLLVSQVAAIPRFARGRLGTSQK